MDATQPWAPEDNHDQSCAFCGATRPTFVHRLDPAHVEFRLYGKGHTLPSFWATCACCEAVVTSGDEAKVLHLLEYQQEDDAIAKRAVLSAFRASDMGGEALAEGAPNTIQS